MPRNFVSAVGILTVSLFAALTAMGPCVWSYAREAYQRTGYGLPLPWFEVSVPNKAVALFRPATLYELRRIGLVVDAVCALVLAAGAVKLHHVYRLRLLRRQERRCVSCGYSLRGLDRPRCPECGTPFDPACLRDLPAE